jgi:hypothetical protein
MSSQKDYSGYSSFNNGPLYDPLTKSPSGFYKTNRNGNVRKIECAAELSYLERSNARSTEELQIKIVHRFAQGVCDELIRDPSYFHCIDRDTNQNEMSFVYRSAIFIAESPHDKYLNMLGNEFMVDGQSFSNDELIQSVKNTFPERFI